MVTVTAEELADRLEALPGVAAADALSAADSPLNHPEIELILTADDLPEHVATELYSSDFSPARLEPRSPDHLIAIAAH